MMSRIAEFVAVLSCSLFAGAAIYISLVEHPARMECGVEAAATEFPPSYRRATIMQATCAALGLLSSVVAWLAGATFWWLVGGILLGFGDPIYFDSDSADQQAPVESDAGQAVAPNRTAALALGGIAYSKERSQRIGAALVLVCSNLHQGSMRIRC